MLDLLDEQYKDEEYSNCNGVCDCDEDIEIENYSKDALKQLKQMQEAERIMQTSGLMDKTETANNNKPAHLNVEGSAHHWQSVLDQKKESILHDRQKQAANKNRRDASQHDSSKTADQVKVIMQAYWQKLFQPSDPKDKDMIATIIEKFTLNEEQA